MINPNFTELTKLGFNFVARGLWINRTNNMCITFDESYRNTYRAFTSERPHYCNIVRNKSGNEMRFRSPQAAAKYALTLRGQK